jgi:hypothetical protein
MATKDNHPILCTQVDGHKNPDPAQLGNSKYRKVGLEAQNVPADHLYYLPSLTSADQESLDTYGGPVDPARTCLVQPAYEGSLNGVVIGAVKDFPMVGTTIPGNNDLYGDAINRLSNNPWNQQLEVFAKSTLKTEMRGGKMVKVAKGDQKYMPSMGNFKPYYQETFDEIGRRWEQFKNVPTATTPFTNIINGNMLSQLPGKIFSLASTFKGLSSGQKSKIQESVPPQVYQMIEASFGSLRDEPTEMDKGFNNRVHQETLANNMVDLLCQCSSFADIVAVKERLNYDRTLYGIENLPEVEFRVDSGFGEVGIIIDADGEARPNVSNAVIQSQQEFSGFLVGPDYDFDDIAQFYGTITSNTLTVSQMVYGNVVAGSANTLSGNGILEGTYIIRPLTGTGNTGTYAISTATTTLPNTIITIVAKNDTLKNTQSGGGGGGGGGFPGMASGKNFFGEASKLIGEVMPVLNPKGQKKIMSLMKNVVESSGGPNVKIGQNGVVEGLKHVFEKGIGFIK